MRIGFDAKRYFHNSTGLGNYSRDLVRILSEYFPENSYFLYNTKPDKQRSALLNPKNTFEKLPDSFFGKKLKGLWRTFWVKKQIKEDKIDIFHGLSGEIPIGLPKNIKSVVTIHDLIFMRYPNLYSFFDRKIHFRKFRYAARKADCVVAISEQTKSDIIKYLKIKPQKIKVVYQGCSDVFKENFSPEEKEAVRKKLNLPNEFVLNVGTIEERKNALTIVKAIKNLDTKLVLVGRKTKYYEQIEQYVRNNDMQDKIIHLAGISQRELAVVYQLATVMAYPSAFEGFGIPIIEALFSKTPVITTNSGVFPEAGGAHSLYINPSDEKELQEKIEFLLKNPEKRVTIAEKGWEYAQRFTDSVIAKQWDLLYKNLLC
ncbi:MAG: glycosyltransferase family 1 protein [Bergeyella sp.]